MVQTVLSVIEFNTVVDTMLKTGVGKVQVKGEVSEFKIAQNKFAYFNLKDSDSVVNCFAMAFKLDFPLEDGHAVVVTGTPGIHLKSGRYSLTVESVTLHGAGALQKAFEQLKAKLAAEGLFEPEHKRSLPRFPKTIGVITSPTGAAIHDIRKVINSRWVGVTLTLVPAQVQGLNAVDELVAAIATFNQNHPVDVIIFGRGGGSLEDLQAFNAERVARAIFASKIPIVAAIGHEHNISIADLVADVRAATPSHAAELVVPDRKEVIGQILQTRQMLNQHVMTKLHLATRHVQSSTHNLQRLIGQQLAAIKALIKGFGARLHTATRLIPAERRHISEITGRLTSIATTQHHLIRQTLHEYQRVLAALSPTAILERGYSITYTRSGAVITSVAHLPLDGRIKTQLRDGSFTSQCQSAKPLKTLKSSHPKPQNPELNLKF